MDLDAIVFNPISSTILKWLLFKAVSWGHDFQPCTAMVWDCLGVGLLLGLYDCWVILVTSHIIFS
jgi:hypothetical protein